MTEAEALAKGKILGQLITEYKAQQVDAWLQCDNWEKRHDYHAKINAAVDIEAFIRNKASEHER